MTALAKIDPRKLATMKAVAAPPKCDPHLKALAESVVSGSTPFPKRPGMKAEAEARIAVLDDLLAASDPVDLMKWLSELGPTVRNAPDHETPDGYAQVMRDASSIWQDCGRLPRAVWCAETRHRWRTQPLRGNYAPGSFWPMGGELFPILKAYAVEIQAEAYACRRLVRAMTQAAEEAQPVPKPTEDEKRGVDETLAAWRVGQLLAKLQAEMGLSSDEDA